MQIKKSEFIKSASDVGGFIVSDLPEIVIAGKSNVGKSSFINFLTNNSKLARTSNTPGRTRLVNYFLINDDFFFVDLPGYGYAKGSKVDIRNWGILMDDYFRMSKKIKHVIHLVDIRHLPTAEDKEFLNFLYSYRLPFSVIATKQDKIPRSAVKPALMAIANDLKLSIGNIFAVSSEKKQGKEQVFELIEQALSVNFIQDEEDDFDSDELEGEVLEQPLYSEEL